MFPSVPSTFEGRLTSPIPGIVLFLFLLAVAALSILLIRAPAPVSESAPADQFSAARALPHIEALAIHPHPVGTQAHAEARDYLLAQLEQLGLEPQVQKTVAVHGVVAMNVENVVARLPGSNSGGKAVLLNAHYDSVATGPGAKDDASGVAALLETARALEASSQPLMNDVIFLFSDGEEEDLNGAVAFVEQHPWAKQVGLVFVVDAGDSTGPAYTGGTSLDNNWLISEYAQAVPYPLASSLAPAVVRHMYSAAGDFDIFKDAGYPGLSFGSIGKSAYYHTALDNLADVDLRSLQHQGSYTLSLARHFGNLDLTATHSGNAVYFNVVGHYLLVHYPQSWVFPWVALAALICAGALVFGLRWKQVSLRRVLLGGLASLLVAVILAGVGYLVWRLILVGYPQYDPSKFEVGANTYNSLYYWLALMALGMGLASLVHSGLRTRIRAAELASGALLLWLVLAVGVSIWIAGASYIVTWPLLFSSLGLWGWFALGRYRPAAIWRIVWIAVFTIPAILLLAFFIYAGGRALSIQMIWVPMAVLGLLVGLLALPLEIIARPRSSWFPALMGLIVVGFLIAGHLTSDYTPTRPARDGVYYALDADKGEAYWLGYWVEEGGQDVYTKQFLGEDAQGGDIRDIWPWATSEAYKASAPLAELLTPKVGQLDTTGAGTLRLQVVPTPGTWVISLWTVPGPTPVTYYVNGEAVETDGLLIYYAPPAEGFDVIVEAPTLDTLTLRVVDQTLGMPTLPGFDYEPRPDWIIPDTGATHKTTAVAKTFAFENR